MKPENARAGANVEHEGHTIICGATLCGKTTLAHRLAQFDEEDKKHIVVYDPVLTGTAAGEWPTKNVALFDDERKFLKYVHGTHGEETSIYVDEAADLFDHSKKENRWILTRGRHLGYKVTIITQRPKMVHPSVRAQTSRAFVFRLKVSDSKEVIGDYGHDYRSGGLGQQELDQGDFLVLYSGHAQVLRANIFELVNRPRGAEWNSILSPPLSPSSSSQSYGASTRSEPQSPAGRRNKLSNSARAPTLTPKD